MNIISCENCGVVIDVDRVSYERIYDDHDNIDHDKAIWNGDDYVPAIKCPACKTKISIDDGGTE